LIVFSVTFAITLAIVVGQRLSTEAMAVLVGVAAGVAASIPTSLIIVWMARRALADPPRTAISPETRSDSSEPDAKIIVVPAPTTPYPTSNSFGAFRPSLSQFAPTTAPRQFTIIGGEASEEDVLPWR
jgi:hypothetical protein